MELLHVLSARRSVRAYQDTPVEDAQLEQALGKLEQALGKL